MMWKNSWTPEDNDIIIPVIGPLGAGKSRFVNYIAGTRVARVGHGLKQGNANFLAVVIDSSLSAAALMGRRLVLVDTPGFDEPHCDEVGMLSRTYSWLKNTHDFKKDPKLAGVICLRDISLARMLGTTHKNPDGFQKFCGDDTTLRSVVLCTTKWSDTHKKEGDQRTQQLCNVYWKEVIANGSTVHKFEDSQESAWKAVKLIIGEKMEPLQIQDMLDDVYKLLPDTGAGRQLRHSLNRMLQVVDEAFERDSARREKLYVHIVAIRAKIREMRTPTSQRVLGFLHLGMDRILNIFTPSDQKVSPVEGVKLGMDIDRLILLFGETTDSKRTLIDRLSGDQVTALGNEGPDTSEVPCWFIERGDHSLVVIEAPGFDSSDGLTQVSQKICTWLRNSCCEDMRFGIIYLVGLPLLPHAREAMERFPLASNTLFATFTEGPTNEESGETTSQIEYTFDGSVVPFLETCEHASKMFNIALGKPIELNLLLSRLHVEENDKKRNHTGHGQPRILGRVIK